MSHPNNDELNAVDFLLKGKPTDFQLELLQLGRKLHWDENDPGFAVPLAMGQIENVLAVYPDRIKAAMDEASQQSEMKWTRIQAALRVSAEKGVQAAGRIDGRLDEVRSLLDAEFERVEDLLQAERLEMQRAMATERELMAQERADMMRLAQMVTEQQKQVLVAQTNELIQEGAISAQRQAEAQVKQIVKGVRKKHFWETIAVAMLAAMSMLVVGWIDWWAIAGPSAAVDFSVGAIGAAHWHSAGGNQLDFGEGESGGVFLWHQASKRSAVSVGE